VIPARTACAVVLVILSAAPALGQGVFSNDPFEEARERSVREGKVLLVEVLASDDRHAGWFDEKRWSDRGVRAWVKENAIRAAHRPFARLGASRGAGQRAGHGLWHLKRSSQLDPPLDFAP
jgi:hypothetical protein